MMGVLRALVGGAWVDVASGSDEVWVSPDQPTAGQGYELWVDTDDDPVATDQANYWNSAWGIVGQLNNPTGTQVSMPTANTTYAGMSLTVNLRNDRQYSLNGHSRALTVPSTSSFHVFIAPALANSSLVLDDWVYVSPTAGVYATWDVSQPFTVTANGSYTITISVSCSVANASFFPTNMNVTDIGPVTRAAVNPPSGQPQVAAAGNALGVVAVGSFTIGAPLVVNASTETQITSNISMTMNVGRRYRFSLRCRAWYSSVITACNVRLRDGSTTLHSGVPLPHVPAAGTYNTVTYDWLLDGDGVARSFNIALFSANVINIYTDTSAYFYVEDVGPNSAPALPIPDTPPAWIPMTLVNGWANLGGFQPAAYRKVGDVVYLRGVIYAPSSGMAQTITTMPVGFRPLGQEIFFVNTAYSTYAAGQNRIDILTSGVIQMGVVPAASCWLSFANTSFSVT